MLGFTELLSAQAGVSAEMKADLGQILKSGKRATELTRQLQAFSEPRTFRAEPIDVNQVLRRIRDMLARLMHEHTTFVCAPRLFEPAVIHVDPSELEQAIIHVVRATPAAAIKPSGGTVTVDVAHVCRIRRRISVATSSASASSTPASAWTGRRRRACSSRSSRPSRRTLKAPASACPSLTASCGKAAELIDVQSSLNGGTTVTLLSFPAM